MKYYAKTDGREFKFDPELITPGGLGETVSTRTTALDAINGNLFSLISDGTSHEIFVSKVDGGYRVQICGRAHFVSVENEKERFVRSLVSRNDEEDSRFELKAPMPGLVMKVLVEPGQAVKRGEGLCIIEAMKMENEIRSPVDGVVTKIFKKPSDSVEKDALLMRLE